MAHEALLSLSLMIERFLNISKCRNIFLSIPETESVYQEVWSLKSILELNHFKESERLIALKREILETIPKFRDLLQDHINKCLLLFSKSQSLYAGGGSSNELIFYQNLEEVKKEMFSFDETITQIDLGFYSEKSLETRNKVSPLADPDKALVSLTLIIESFLNMSYFNNFHLIRETELVQGAVNYIKAILTRLQIHDKEDEIRSKGEMLEAITKLRDALQDYINKCQLLFSESQSLDDESRSESIFYQDLEKVRKEMISLLETMMKIKEEYNAEDLKTSNKEPPLADEVFGGNKALYIRGVNDEDLQQLINRVTGDFSPLNNIISVEGMAGIGKTTIVKALFNDPVISDYFECRVFLRVGPHYCIKDILPDLVCLFPNYNKILGIEKREDQLRTQIYEFLIDKRYLIVLDDVWDNAYWDPRPMAFFPCASGNRMIVTTRLSNRSLFCDYVYKIRFLNEKESWNLFCSKVVVPPGLEKVGKKIVKKCGGLPLGIISIANILSKVEKTLNYWEKVAKDDNMLALVTEEGSHMSNSLFLSYKHLPPHLKECYLYFGVFPLNHEFSVSKLIKLWIGEGLVEAKYFQTFEDTARGYLEVLVSHNVVLVRQQSSSGGTKTCSAHYLFWHLLVREAANKKIFHLINSYHSAFSEGIHCQRRLCIHMNTLLGFKSVSESIESVSNVRSFICTGPEHQYPISVCSGLTSIKVLDALTIRLYKFPIGILEQVELKYIAFTYDGKLPSSISKLKNLAYLIVHLYHQTIIDSSPSYMPIEIWNMQELRHLQVMGRDLPHPVDGAKLLNLLTLLGVSDRSCTKEVFRSIPNLKKLGVRIVLPQGIFETLHIFNHLALLSRLKSFKCIVPNPNPRSQHVLVLRESVFPSSLTKLTLSGCGFEWKDMSIIGALRNLQVLKLRCYAFQGPEWVVDEKEFQKLEHLLLENTDLVHWRVGYATEEILDPIFHNKKILKKICFPRLKRLIIMHCYKLEEIPYEFVHLKILEMIELVDCSPSTLASVKHILEEHKKYGDEKFKVQVYSSLNDEKH